MLQWFADWDHQQEIRELEKEIFFLQNEAFDAGMREDSEAIKRIAKEIEKKDRELCALKGETHEHC